MKKLFGLTILCLIVAFEQPISQKAAATSTDSENEIRQIELAGWLKASQSLHSNSLHTAKITRDPYIGKPDLRKFGYVEMIVGNCRHRTIACRPIQPGIMNLGVKKLVV